MEDEPAFRLLRPLGAGQFGEVWLGEDRATFAKVALKHLRQRDAGGLGEDEWKLKKEFRVLADLAHPHLVRMLSLHRQEEQLWLVMDYVDGVPLVDYVRGHLAIGEDLDVVGQARLTECLAQLADALAALHARGVLHRDLKPSNVLVEADGRLVVLDFGLARFGGEPREDGQMIGSPAYMAPELAYGEEAGASSDWYAVGVMLYQCWGGTVPFSGNFAQQLDAKYLLVDQVAESLRRRAPPDIARLFLELCRPEAASRRSTQMQPAAQTLSTRTLPFVGRASELGQLRAVLHPTLTSGFGVVVVSGPSGIGKTRLVQHFLESIESPSSEGRGSLVVQASCHPLDGSSFNAFESAFAQLAHELGAQGEFESSMAELAEQIAPIFGAFGRFTRLGRSGAPQVAHTEERQRRAFEACRRLLMVLSRSRPLFLWIDDSQWADRDSVALLLQLVSQKAPVGLRLVLTSRECSEDPLVNALLRADPPVPFSEITLAPLSSTDAQSLMSRLRPSWPAPKLERALNEAQGLPFFLSQWGQTRAGEDVEEEGLGHALRRRLSELSASAHSLLVTAALTSAPLSLGTAARLASSPHEAAHALHDLRVGRWLRGGSDLSPLKSQSYYLYHDRLREFVLDGMDESAQRGVHARWARALKGTGSEQFAIVAEHFKKAGEREKALQYSRLAAEQASQQLGFARAAELYAQVLELSADEPIQTRIRFAEALEYSGQVQESALQFELSARVLAQAGKQEEAWDLRRKAVTQRLRVGEFQAGVGQLREVLAHYQLRAPRSNLLCILLILRDRFWSLFLARRNLLAPEKPTFEPVLEACMAAVVGLNGADILRSSLFQARYTRLALSHGSKRHKVRALSGELSYVACAEGQSSRSKLALVSTCIAQLESNDARVDAFWTQLHRGAASHFLGEFAEVEAKMFETERLLDQEPNENPFERMLARLYRGWSWAYHGNFGSLREQGPRLFLDACTKNHLLAQGAFSLGLSNLAWLAAGDSEQARHVVVTTIEKFPAVPFNSMHYLAAMALCQVDWYEGKALEPYQRIEALWPQLRRSLFLQLRFFRIEATWLRARAAWALAQQSAPQRRTRLLREVSKHARRLRTEKEPWACALGELLGAASRTKVVQPDLAVRLCDDHEGRLRAQQVHSVADALRALAGRTPPSWQGSVEDPSRFARAVLPGLGEGWTHHDCAP